MSDYVHLTCQFPVWILADDEFLFGENGDLIKGILTLPNPFDSGRRCQPLFESEEAAKDWIAKVNTSGQRKLRLLRIADPSVYQSILEQQIERFGLQDVVRYLPHCDPPMYAMDAKEAVNSIARSLSSANN